MFLDLSASVEVAFEMPLDNFPCKVLDSDAFEEQYGLFSLV
jgi:hypothetical protein